MATLNRGPIVASAAALLTLALAAPALAANRYAEPGGNGPVATCPQADPCGIQAAVENAAVANGDVITLLPGTYPLANDAIEVADAVTIQGLAGAARPLMVVGTNYGVRFYVPGVTLRYVAIEQGPGVGSALEVGGGVVDNVIAHSNSSFEACRIYDTTITDSVCANSGTGEAILGNAIPGTSTSTLRNVTAYAQSAPAIQLTSFSGSITINATNLIAYGFPVDIRARADGFGNTATVVTDHSNYLYEDEVATNGGTPFVTNPGANNNQTAAPHFVNAAAGNFHQAADSPTIDAGTAAAGLGSADIDDEARLQGPAPDIGADEFTHVDTTAPETTITSGPRRRVRTNRRRVRVRLEFIANEAGASFDCRLDGIAYPSCTSPFRARVRRGRHRFEVQAFDAAGNFDALPASRTWRVRRRR